MSEVRFTGVRKSYGAAVVVPDFSLDIAEGEFVTLLGPSGCGKTTILRCLAGLEHPDGGVISLAGETVSDPGRGVRVPPNRRNLGLVFQSYALWPHLTVFGNVAYPLKVRRTPKAQIRAKVADALALVGLAGTERRQAMALSGGQQQRVALARAIVADPAVLLLDEPLSNLDAQRRAQLRAELRRIHRASPRTTLYVTHDQVEALTMSDRVVVMDAGRILQTGTPAEVFQSPETEFVARFLGYDNLVGGTVTRTDGDAVTVRPTGFPGELHVSSDRQVRAGDSVTVAFRGSALSIAGTSANGPNALRARVEDAAYSGDAVHYALSPDGADGPIRLSAHVPTSGAVPPSAVGDPVDLRLDPSALVLLRA
ncbi:ABC transporter ATP-binding protein [Actinomadura litoris]|uniref:ATP-binding cassette domain-containing protein n=1 Tax=Actinomadura litoris TaxID=2678616 RepID=A0A7K1L9F7_9ACTN|nr:ABC transporter ATP-binding protein [Actinomadura litoris]MUN41058.1 ATP-binding cassette domain-containing protein [Actinomadura litoris]